MTTLAQKQALREFIARWKAAEGSEEREARSFWIELAEQVLGIDNPTQVLEFERKVKGRKIDVFYEDMGILIEQKSRGVSLDDKSERSKRAGEETPFEQAKWYADNLPNSLRPRWIITSNFDEIRIYDLDTDSPEDTYVTITLDELENQIHLLSFFTDKSASRLVKEKELSVQAGQIVGRLYKSLSKQYHNIETDINEQQSLNMLIVRFVFLLYAEDAGILHERHAFLNYMKGIEPEQFRQALISLFDVLNTPEHKRDPYLNEKLAAFPYINGSLFAQRDIIIPQFTLEIKYDLLKEASLEFDWSGISPTIFGAAFESTLNPDTRREGGMHYTSIENIHKVIDPLFLDDLKAELAAIEGESVEKRRHLLLRQFQNKLASIKVLDPACGSGNFLTESYLSLRKLENRVIEGLMGSQRMLGFEGVENPIKVSIKQFYGIEINDFAVAVAKTALWIAEEQLMDITQDLIAIPLDFLPLTSNDNIHQGNALRLNWEEVLPASECTYIIGNPPFVGYSNHSKDQQEDRASIFGKNCKVLDYVCCWYKRAADYMQDYPVRAAFVSTNSICQGQQVEPLWKPLFESGIHIDFAHTSFIWANDTKDSANVFVIIVGFSRLENPQSRKLFKNDEVALVENINGYLAPAENMFVTKRAKPLCDVPEMVRGCQPTDGGHLLFRKDELQEFLKLEPKAEKYIRPFSMGEDFIKGKERFCLWLVDVPYAEIDSMPYVLERVNKVRDMRLASSKAATRKKAETPWLFDEVRPPKTKTYIGIPVVTSSRRDYIPFGFVTNSMVPGNKLYFIETESVYDFGIVISKFHIAWTRLVSGRLGMGFNYSNTIVYNNFIWPDPTPEERAAIEACAQAVLDARAEYPHKSLAKLYDPDTMPHNLLAAHQALDAAVEAAYHVHFNGNEEAIVAHLFKLYAEAVGE